MTADAMDAVQLLIRQHRELESLLQQVLDQTDEKARKSLFLRAADHLAVHIKSEEDIFYPAVNAARTEDDLLESLEEHLSLKRLLADLMEMDGTDRSFEAKFKVLREQTVHHHKEEEEHLFVTVNKIIGAERRQDLGREMQALQDDLNRQGEPREGVFDETDSAAPLPENAIPSGRKPGLRQSGFS